MDLDITVTSAGKVTVFAASGFIDGKTAPDFQSRILEVIQVADTILINLAQVSFMSSAGLRAMLVTHQQTQQKQNQGKTVALAALPDEIRDNMEATGFLPFFQVFDTVELGLQELG